MLFLVAQTIKTQPAKRETRVWSLGQENPMQKEMATHSSVLTWSGRSMLPEPECLFFSWVREVFSYSVLK